MSHPPTALALYVQRAMPSAQDVLDPAGVQASLAAGTWWIALAIGIIVFLVVAGFALYAALRRRPAASESDPAKEASRTRAMTKWVVGAVAATAVVLIGFLLMDYSTGRATVALSRSDDVLTIDVVGHQWWWEVRYPAPVPARIVTTANEIHVPVGRTVRLRMTSNDVIHSFWVPNLHGKKDLVPGHLSVTHLRADRAGVYRGQCAEFCGHQHAKMGLVVVAEPADSFAAWYEAQLRPSAPPVDSVELRGRDVFLASACVMCHTVRGTPAGGKVAPDLTHIGSRLTLGAASVPNTRGHLGGWISNSQRIKPGNRMPPQQLAPGDLQALLTYLESLR